MPDSPPPTRHGLTNGRFSDGYRTLCVRVCDGYYFPISYATNQGRFKTDAVVCKSMYPPGQAELYVHHTTGEDVSQAVSLTGAPYAKQTFAFAYRSTYDHACASLFRSGSGALVSINKAPVPPKVMAASSAIPSLPRRGKPPESFTRAAAEMPAKPDLPPQADHPSAENRVTVEGLRAVGPGYYYDLPRVASTNAKTRTPAMPERPPVVSTDQLPVAASVLPDPLDFLLHRSTPPPEPAAEPDPAK